MSSVRITEIICLLCSTTYGYVVEYQGEQKVVPTRHRLTTRNRCSNCGGRVVFSASAESAGLLGLRLSSLFPSAAQREESNLWYPSNAPHCARCGTTLWHKQRFGDLCYSCHTMARQEQLGYSEKTKNASDERYCRVCKQRLEKPTPRGKCKACYKRERMQGSRYRLGRKCGVCGAPIRDACKSGYCMAHYRRASVRGIRQDEPRTGESASGVRSGQTARLSLAPPVYQTDEDASGYSPSLLQSRR